MKTLKKTVLYNFFSDFCVCKNANIFYTNLQYKKIENHKCGHEHLNVRLETYTKRSQYHAKWSPQHSDCFYIISNHK